MCGQWEAVSVCLCACAQLCGRASLQEASRQSGLSLPTHSAAALTLNGPSEASWVLQEQNGSCG